MQEHYRLKFEDFSFGTYTRRDGKRLEGLRYLELGGTTDKTEYLSVNHTTLTSTNRTRRIVDNPDDPMSLPKIFDKLKKAAGPGQVYIYCRPASKKKIAEFANKGFPDARMDPNLRVGKNKIGTVSEKCFVVN